MQKTRKILVEFEVVEGVDDKAFLADIARAMDEGDIDGNEIEMLGLPPEVGVEHWPEAVVLEFEDDKIVVNGPFWTMDDAEQFAERGLYPMRLKPTPKQWRHR